MDLMESFRILRRRWILTTLLLLLALGGTAAATYKLPRTYVAASSVVLLTSPNSSKSNGGNPYLSFNGSLSPTGDVVRYEVMDTGTARLLATEGYTAPYVITNAVDTSGPVLLVTVTGSNKTAVEQTMLGVTAELRAKLQELQAGITPGNRITMTTLALGPAKLQRSKLARPLVVIFAFGMVLAFAIPLLVDARVTRRRDQDSGIPPRHRPTRDEGAPAPGDRVRGQQRPADRGAGTYADEDRGSVSAPSPRAHGQRQPR
jgi:hypothetical protein